jgi:hypothetical protein
VKSKTIAVLAFVAFLAVTACYAQSTARLVANIPFEFRIHTATLPAGEYVVNPGVVPKVLLIRCVAENAWVFAQTSATQANQAPKSGMLVFNRYSNTYFLAQVWHPGNDRGYRLPKTKTEREMARNASGTEIASVRATVR